MTNAAAFAAFLFTDIEGSSLKWLNRRAAMQGALAEHDGILRAAIAAHGGEVFKTAGDAFFAAFKRPSDAANAAIAAQKGLAARDWSAVDGLKVRMAVHCGTAEKREGDYFGPALNRCARLLVLGHGGQILITAATAELLASEREVKEVLRQIGTHPLDDPAQPVGIRQVLVVGLPQDFPPLRAPDIRPTNLPRHLTPLIGRESELQAIEELVMANRLVTLTGPGGVGKTRLAIEAGSQLLPRFTHGVWLVELAPLSDPSLVVSAVGTGLRLDLSGNRPARDILISHLENQEILIILDNCEHLVEAAAELIEVLLAGTAAVHILASSQELIGLPGEHVQRVPSLSVPETETPSADEALRAAAVQLLIARARAADPKFSLDAKAAPIAAAICRRLDGIPLALEMAAARVPALGFAALAQGLDARFRILTGGKRTAMPRQRTLHAALDWSHALLDENDRIVFRRLGQFAGGFTLEAATAVVADSALPDHTVVDGLADLVAKSLVAADTTDAGTRYRLLETTRAYALEKLGEAGETETIAKRHALYYRTRMIACVDSWLGTSTTTAWRAAYAPDLDNVRAAIEWALGVSGDSETAVVLAANSYVLFNYLNFFDEGRKWLGLAKPRLDASMSRVLHARFTVSLGASLIHGGYAPTDEAMDLLERAAVLTREPGQERALARVLYMLGIGRVNRAEGDLAAAVALEMKSLAERATEPAGVAGYHVIAGLLGGLRGDFALARQELTLAAKLAQESQHLEAQDFADMVLGMYILRSGDNESAVVHLRNLRGRIGQPPYVDMRRLLATNALLAVALTGRGDYAEATTAMREAIGIARKIGALMTNIDGWVYILAASGKFERAAQLAGWIDKNAAHERGVVRMAQRLRMPADAILRQRLSAPEIDRLMSEGATMNEDEACKLVTED